MSRRDAYRFGAPLYDWLIEPFLAPIRRKTEALIAHRAGAAGGERVLEVACGTGGQARRIARTGRRIFGLDRSPAMLAEAAKKSDGTDNRSLHLLEGNGGALPFADAVFPVILVQFALHEMPPQVRRAVMAEMLRVARSGADFLAADFVPTTGITASSIVLTAVEFAAGRAHFRNGRHFLKEGGIVSLLAGFGLAIVDTWPFFGGNVGLVLARKP